MLPLHLPCGVAQKAGIRYSPLCPSETLSQIKADLEQVNLQVETEVLEGYPVTTVLEAAAMDDISAIAISSGTIGKLQEWLISCFAADVQRLAAA